MKMVSFFIALFCAMQLQAQIEEWTVTLPGPPTAWDFNDGDGLYVTGYIKKGEVTYESYIVKCDSFGKRTTFPISIEGSVGTIPWSLDVRDGLVVVGGQTALDQSSPTNSFSALTSRVGKWKALYKGSGRYHKVTALSISDGVYITVESQGDTTTDWDIALLKYDSTTGDSLWVRRYDGEGRYDSPAMLCVDGEGSAIVAGTSWSSSGGYDFVTIKYDSGGTEQWVRRYDGGWSDEVVAGVTDLGGDIYITGKSYNGDYDFVTIKYDSAGEERWVRRYDHGARDVPADIAIDQLGNIYVAGTMSGGDDPSQAVVVKYDSDGHQMWAVPYIHNGDLSNKGLEIDVDDSGPYVLMESRGLSGNSYIVAKFNPVDGASVWSVRGRLGDEALGLSLDNDSSIYVVGKRGGAGFVAKYRQTEASVVEVEPIDGSMPNEFRLEQNYPNPFNPTTTIAYALQVKGKVKLSVYDLMGKEVAVLVDGIQSAGNHEVRFSGANLTSGVYFYKLQAAEQVITRKMMLLK